LTQRLLLTLSGVFLMVMVYCFIWLSQQAEAPCTKGSDCFRGNRKVDLYDEHL